MPIDVTKDAAIEPLVWEGSACRTAGLILTADQYLARKGERKHSVYRILDGWACRHHLLPDGRRQVTGLFLPGDYCDLVWIQYPIVSQSVITLTKVRALTLSCDEIVKKSFEDDTARRSLWSAALDPVYWQTEWLTNLGRKTAFERLSYLFCELYYRLRRRGLTTGDEYAMPLTQVDLADITGLTPVHVNRTLQSMRARKLITLHAKWLHILDMTALKNIALFRDAIAPNDASRDL